MFSETPSLTLELPSSSGLLPAFVPSPSPSRTPSPVRMPSTSPALEAYVPPAPQPQPQPRTRSNSLHHLISRPSFLTRPTDAPPVPSLPSPPSALDSGPPSPASVNARAGLPLVLSLSKIGITDREPRIKTVSIPHHTRSGKSVLFACRVVPERPSATDSPFAPEMSRHGSLGRMELAGQHEPHTVHRSWPEFVDFSLKVSDAFPGADEGSSLPKLEKKFNIFNKRATVEQQQSDLEHFVARLFAGPDVVKHSSLVRDFFRLRPADVGQPVSLHSSPTEMSPAPSSTGAARGWGEVASADDGSESFANFMAKMDGVRLGGGSVRALRRPELAPKSSAPNLRQLGPSGPGEVFGFEGQRKPNLLRPLMSERANTLDNASRTSAHSLSASSSVSSSTTVTPYGTTNASPASRQPSPLAEKNEPPSPPAEPKKLKSALRHFRSLGDLRGQSKEKETPVPAVPVPAVPHAIQTARNFGQPMTRTFSSTSQASLPPGLSGSPVSSRHRPKSSKSSIGSADDLWGSPAQPSTMVSRRVESLSRTGGRPGLSRNPSSLTGRATNGHRSTPSGSSINSVRSHQTASSSTDLSRSMSDRGFASSTRSSTDYSHSEWSALGQTPPTPPTPMSDLGYSAGSGSGGRYFIENGKLTQSNVVDFAPFYALPPSMSQSRSYDGALSLASSTGSRSHTRKSSLEQGANRHRLSSTASLIGRPQLDTILASPCQVSFPPGAGPLASPAPISPLSPMTPATARSHKVFKLLHPTCNILLRFPAKELTLAALKKAAQGKFEAAQVSLDKANGWGLLYLSKEGPPRLITQEGEFEQLLEDVALFDKVTLKVIG